MALTTRCKFMCNWAQVGANGVPTKVHFDAVYPDKEKDGFAHDENHAFFTATPYGQIDIAVQNPAGAEVLIPGRAYYVDFTLIPLPEPVPAA